MEQLQNHDNEVLHLVFGWETNKINYQTPEPINELTQQIIDFAFQPI